MVSAHNFALKLAATTLSKSDVSERMYSKNRSNLCWSWLTYSSRMLVRPLLTPASCFSKVKDEKTPNR